MMPSAEHDDKDVAAGPIMSSSSSSSRAPAENQYSLIHVRKGNDDNGGGGEYYNVFATPDISSNISDKFQCKSLAWCLTGQAQSITTLYLVGCELTILPKEVAELPHLSQLKLGYNQLSDLPEELAQLAELKVLCLTNNRFETVPRVALGMTTLTDLNMERNPVNKIEHFPWEWVECMSSLSFSRMNARTLPASLGRLKHANVDTHWVKRPLLQNIVDVLFFMFHD